MRPMHLSDHDQSAGSLLSGGALDMAGEGIDAWLADRHNDPMQAMHRWALTPSGKLIRPMLLLESAGAVGGSYEQVLPAAVGIELAHVGSLMHDDIIDGDDMRRGKASVHRRFGTSHAILGADALFFSFFQELGKCRRRGVADTAVVEAMEIVGAAGRDIAGGVAREISLSGWVSGSRGDADEAFGTYVEMVRLKTAALLGAACRVGAVLGGGTAAQADALEAYGQALGIAFQIRDDLLPYRSDGASADKPADSDLRNQRPALPLLLVGVLGSAEERSRLAELITDESPAPDRTRRLAELLEESGALKESRRVAEEYAGRCHQALAMLPPSEHRELLADLVGLVTDPNAALAPDSPGGPPA